MWHSPLCHPIHSWHSCSFHLHNLLCVCVTLAMVSGCSLNVTGSSSRRVGLCVKGLDCRMRVKQKCFSIEPVCSLCQTVLPCKLTQTTVACTTSMLKQHPSMFQQCLFVCHAVHYYSDIIIGSGWQPSSYRGRVACKEGWGLPAWSIRGSGGCGGCVCSHRQGWWVGREFVGYF